MRILIIGLNFHPELIGIGKYTGEMATWLSEQGHKLRVITTPPYYPHWQIAEGYSRWKYSHEIWGEIQVTRCPFWVPREPSGLKRLLHLFSFALSALPAAILGTTWRPEIVLSIAPAFFSAPVGLLAARLSGAKAWLHIQDFELDAALGLGIMPFPKITSPVAERVEAFILRNYDRVSAISKKMVSRLIEKGVPEDRATYFPNWVDTEEIYPLDDPHTFRNKLDIDEDQVVVLYAGNLGHKQGLEVVLESARELIDDPTIVFLFAGDGAVRRSMELQAKNLSNVRFIPLQPVENLNALLNTADIHILPQRADAADLVMPSKLLGILASGRPVIAMAETNTELDQVVQQVGSVIPPEDVTSFVSAIRTLTRNHDLRNKYGESGRNLVMYNWDRQIVLGNFEAQLERITSSSS